MAITNSQSGTRIDEVEERMVPSTWHVQMMETAMAWAMPGDTRDYAAMATLVTSAQVAKAWVRTDRRFAAVSWSRRRGKTLATWSWAERKR